MSTNEDVIEVEEIKEEVKVEEATQKEATKGGK